MSSYRDNAPTEGEVSPRGAGKEVLSFRCYPDAEGRVLAHVIGSVAQRLPSCLRGALGETSWRYSEFFQCNNIRSIHTRPHPSGAWASPTRFAMFSEPPITSGHNLLSFEEATVGEQGRRCAGGRSAAGGGTCGEHHPYQVRII